MKLPFKYSAHSEVIYTIAKGLHDAGFLKTYLELGCKKGGTFNKIAPLADVAYAVDVNESYYRKIKGNKNLKWVCATSKDFLENYNKEFKFDMIFIDADHSYEASLSDFQLSFPLLDDNRIIVMHDTYPPTEAFSKSGLCADTYKTAEWIRKNMTNQAEVLTLPFYFGITIIRKTSKHLHWK